MRRHFLIAAAAAALLAAAAPAPASARGADYVFDGGGAAARAEVRRALTASAFDWSVIPARVVVHIRSGVDSHATAGHVWLDEDLLRTGRFAWAVVQDEFAHQIDFFLFDAAVRERLNRELGGRMWCYGEGRAAHGEYGCERFASTLVWAYWQSPDNAYRPRSAGDESAALAPARFRALLATVLPRAAR